MITLQNVSFKRDYTFILEDINLTIGQGEFIGVLGPNGAGKTTLLNLIIGSLRPHQGSIHYDFSPNLVPMEIRKHIGVVLEDSFLYDDLSIRENLEFFATLYHLSKPMEREKRIEELLRIYNLEKRGNDRISSLSKGLKKRVSLMRGMIHRPSLWLLDEPFDGLDQESYDILSNQMMQHVQRRGSVLLISHNKEHIFHLATRAILLNKGEIQLDCALPAEEKRVKTYYQGMFKERESRHVLS